TVQVVQAACLVRTATAPLLAAMLPHIPADEALDRLRALPFVTAGPHGLLMHDAVRRPGAAPLKPRGPAAAQADPRAASQRGLCPIPAGTAIGPLALHCGRNLPA